MSETVNWKNIAIGLLAGTTIGMALTTIIGNLVDGDEVYTFQSDDGKSTAVVVSYRGGLFAHAHPLEQDYSDVNIGFTIGSAIGHSHSDTSSLYRIVFVRGECKIQYYNKNNTTARKRVINKRVKGLGLPIGDGTTRPDEVAVPETTFLDPAWTDLEDDKSLSGGGHKHKLKVICFIDKDGIKHEYL